MAAGTGWHHQDIVGSVRKGGTTLTALAIKHGYGKSTLHSALYKRHPKAQAIIADFLGVSRHEIWPAWYGPKDELLPLQPIETPAPRRRRAA